MNMHKPLHLAATIFLSYLIFPVTISAVNPYQVAGLLESPRTLNLPPTSKQTYTWSLQGEALKVIRPLCKPGGVHCISNNSNATWYAYDYQTNQIGQSQADRNQFSQYVQENPGVIWIIGNEPDIEDQDNLTIPEYTRMYHLYYHFIKDRDPTARIANAGLVGVLGYRNFPHQETWFNNMLTEYQNRFNSPMPIDIWNTHAYYQRVDPDVTPWVPPDEMSQLVMDNIVNPFINYVQTVDNGRYRYQEIILSEIGIAFGWGESNSYTQTELNQFMDHYTSDLEEKVISGDLDRFYWFYGGHIPEGIFRQSSLLNANGQPNQLGIRYRNRAQAWENTHPSFTGDIEPSYTNGVVNVLDWKNFIAQINTASVLPDFNNSNAVDILDYNRLVNNFGLTTDTQFAIPNHSFENGTTNWNRSNDVSASNFFTVDCQEWGWCQTGRYYLKAVTQSDGQPPFDPHITSNWIETNQNLSGKTFEVRFYVGSHSGNQTLTHLALQRYPSNGDWSQTTAAFAPLTATTQWQQFYRQVTFPVPENNSSTSQMRVILRPPFDEQNQTPVYFDNIRVRQIGY